MKKQKYYGYVLIALLLLAIGLLFIVFHQSFRHLTIAIGVVLAAYGLVFGILTIAQKERGFLFAVKIMLAVICMLCGISTAVLYEQAVEVIAPLFALLLVMDGSFKLHTTAMAKRYGVGGWWALFIPAVILIAGGFFIIRFAFDTSAIMSVFLGVLLLIDAVINFASVIFVPKYHHRMRDEILAQARAVAS